MFFLSLHLHFKSYKHIICFTKFLIKSQIRIEKASNLNFGWSWRLYSIIELLFLFLWIHHSFVFFLFLFWFYQRLTCYLFYLVYHKVCLVKLWNLFTQLFQRLKLFLRSTKNFYIILFLFQKSLKIFFSRSYCIILYCSFSSIWYILNSFYLLASCSALKTCLAFCFYWSSYTLYLSPSTSSLRVWFWCSTFL